jgi:hypothetical protein
MSDLRALLPALPLRPTVHPASCSDGIVFLDIAGDTYLSLYAPRPASGVDRRETDIDQASLAAILDDAGLLRTGPLPTARDLPDPMPAWRALPVPPHTRPPFGIVAAFCVALVQATVRFRRRSFPDMLGWASSNRTGGVSLSEQDLARLVGWFDRLGLWLPLRPLCLFRSHLLLHFLRRVGGDADWVFGVTLFPFHAHCWLAVGDLLVGERVDRAEDFSVIFSTAGRDA